MEGVLFTNLIVCKIYSHAYLDNLRIYSHLRYMEMIRHLLCMTLDHFPVLRLEITQKRKRPDSEEYLNFV